MSAAYEGLTRNQRMWIIGVAGLIFLCNMAFAWVVMSNATANIQFNEQDRISAVALSSNAGNHENEAILRIHAIDAVTNIKFIANKQAIVLSAFAGAFGLCAAGFALFLIGADGAFQFNASQGTNGAQIVLSGTAPGLFCFLIAGILIIAGILHRTDLNLGSVTIPQGVLLTAPDQASGSGPADVTLDSELGELGANKRKSK